MSVPFGNELVAAQMTKLAENGGKLPDDLRR
jgi:hypothetical protein